MQDKYGRGIVPDSSMVKSGDITLPNRVFDGIWAIMDAMMRSVKFQTRTRIVVEYDPQKEKWSIQFSQPKEEQGNPQEDRQAAE